MKKIIVAIIISFFGICNVYAIPPGFNVQGRLTDSNGINKDGIFQIMFSIFKDEVGGTAVWKKSKMVNVKNGNFQVLLQGGDKDDSTLQIETAVKDLDYAYVEIKVNNEAPMVPRQPLLRSPFSSSVDLTGSVVWFVRQTCPNGFLSADGTLIPGGEHPKLAVAMGKGANESFTLPDLRGSFIRGWDGEGATAKNLDPGRIFGSYQEDEFKSHSHLYRDPLNRNGSGGNKGPGHDHNYSLINTEPTGGSETRPKNIALMPCIKY